MWEKIEGLEYHSHLRPHAVDVLVGDELSVDVDLTRCRLLKPVDAAEHSGFTGARWPYDAEHFSLFYVLVDALKNLKVAKALFEPFDFYHAHAADSLLATLRS